MSIGSSITNYFRTLARGTTNVGFPTSTPVDANTQALHVNLSGVNAVNATLGAETSKVIGTVNVAVGQTVGLVAGTASIGSLVANQSVNTSQVNGVAPLMGNGVTGTGSQRVTIASDNMAFPVNATLAAETTKVIGTVNQGTSPWVTNDPGLPDTLGQKPMATSTSVVIASDQSGILVNPDLTVAPLALAALDALVQIPLNGHGTVIVVATGTFAGTVSFQGLMPDGSWQAINGFSALDGGKTGGLFSGAGQVRIISSGLRAVRAIMTAYTSGTANVSLQAAYSTFTPPAPSVVYEGTTSADSIAAVVVLARTAGTGAAAVAKTPIVDANGGWVLGASAAAIGTVVANAGTNLNTSALALDATLTGGTQKAIARGGVKGTAVAGDITSNPVDANTQALHVNLAGVNSVNATLGAETTKVIGTVNVSAGQTVGLVAGTAVIGALVTNQSVNTAQINGVATLVGNGVTGTGSQRVTIASDNTAFAVNSTLSAETTKVIGTVNQGTSPWVTNDPGLPDTLGQKTMAASTGIVIASDQSSIPVAATLLAETTKVIGTVNIATGQTVGLVAGTSVIGALTANQSVNTAQISGATALVGNGITGTGSQRVTIASDNTAFAVNANAGTNLNTSALSLETTQAAVKAKTDNLDVLLSTRATELTLAAIKAKTDNLDVLLSTRTKPADVQLADVSDRAARLVGSVRNQDGAGNAIASLGDGVAGNIGLGVSGIATNYYVSAAGANSTTIQLAAGMTFTGTIETVSSQQTISILLTCDQPSTLIFTQYITTASGTKVNTLSFDILANIGFSRAFTANGNFYNLSITNNGSVPTTTLNLNTAQGTLPAVTNLGNAPTSINEVNGIALTLGLAAMTKSIPVVVASDQNVISVTSPEMANQILILTEMRLLTLLFANAFNPSDNLDGLRSEILSTLN